MHEGSGVGVIKSVAFATVLVGMEDEHLNRN